MGRRDRRRGSSPGVVAVVGAAIPDLLAPTTSVRNDRKDKSRSSATGQVLGRNLAGPRHAKHDQTTCTDGCVRMQVPEAEWLFPQVSVGTPVVPCSGGRLLRHPLRRDRRDRRRRRAVPAGEAPLRDRVLRRQQLHRPQDRRPDHQRALRGGRPGRAVPRAPGPRDLRARRRAGGRAGGDARLRRARREATAFAEEDGTTVVVVGGKPGKAYEVLGFEVWAPFNLLYEAGDYAEAADRARGVIEAHPEAVGAFFYLACCEALAGRADDAARHLRYALEAVGAAAGPRRRNSDLDSIRDRPEIAELLAGSEGPEPGQQHDDTVSLLFGIWPAITIVSPVGPVQRVWYGRCTALLPTSSRGHDRLIPAEPSGSRDSGGGLRHGLCSFPAALRGHVARDRRDKTS